MNYYLIFCIILLCCISIIILALRNIKSLTKEITKLENLEKEELKEYFKEEWKTEEEKLNLKISGLESTLKEKEKRYEEVNQDLDLYRNGKLKEINEAAAEYKERKQLIVDNGIKEYRNFTNDFFNSELELQKEQIEQVKEQKEDLLKDIEIIKEILEEERRKREAINKQIRKQRELEEQQDFYRIQLDPKDVDDIKILRDIAPRLRHPEAINKVIWSGYYQKPLAELRKRLLPNGDVSCVYMATRMKTLEMYIGQTTSFDKRLQEHTRSALGIGTLASSMLHKKMYEDGPEQFLWQILEVVPKDKLRERESYYIDFYKSNKFGLNTLSGDKNK